MDRPEARAQAAQVAVDKDAKLPLDLYKRPEYIIHTASLLALKQQQEIASSFTTSTT